MLVLQSAQEVAMEKDAVDDLLKSDEEDIVAVERDDTFELARTNPAAYRERMYNCPAMKGLRTAGTLGGLSLLAIFLIFAGAISLCSKNHTWMTVGILALIGALATIVLGFKKASTTS